MSPPWMVSLHGGHSGEFCDHAEGSLREILNAAVGAGYQVFGVSEHAPRGEARFLYAEERTRGWDAARTEADFARYMAALPDLVAEFAPRLALLRGFEAEVVPAKDYARRMAAYRSATFEDGSAVFDYMVGSVHYVDEIQIDGEVADFRRATESCGGVEALAVRYYQTVAEMVETLRPEVVGHLDLIKKTVVKAGFERGALQSPRVYAAAESALDAIRAYGAILDLNTAGWRKGLGEPYPAPWLVSLATHRGLPFCFGDDSHRPSEVGQGIAQAREYLLELGVASITVLIRAQNCGGVERRKVSLEW